VNERFRSEYVPALQGNTVRRGVTRTNLVGYLRDQPVCCGTVLLEDSFCGIYNVGTHVSFQKKGIGRQLTLELLRSAFRAGASSVYLQCATNTHVEELYQSVGFSIVETPGIFTLEVS
jgi:ribosomal protein S18 acetylase RimI-like enzyme